MLLGDSSEILDLRSGVYRHYKGPLYQVIGYSHNASEDNRVEVLYMGLEIDPEKPGPRWCTREWRDFMATVCVEHGGVDAYSETHNALLDATKKTCNPDEWQERFQYMGPVYYKGFES